MKDKFWMIVTINGSVEVDSDDSGRPTLYNEKEAQNRAKALALTLGENYAVCAMEYVFGEKGKMITERIIPQRPTNIGYEGVEENEA
jgi:hypothetical protein